MDAGAVVASVVEGDENTWEVVRNMMGATQLRRRPIPARSAATSASLFTENLVHGSDSQESADREIGIFFPDL